MDDELKHAQERLEAKRKLFGIEAPKKPPSQEVLPGYRDFEQERQQAALNRVNSLMEKWKTPLTGEALWTAQCLIVCGLPINPTNEPRVTRTARLSNGSYLRVTFIRTHDHIPLPYRQDRSMVHFLTHKAVLNQSPWLKWEYVNEYLALFNLCEDSGKNYRMAQERFVRVVYMDLMIEHLDPARKMVEHVKIPLVEGSRISGDVDGEGNWKPMDTAAQMLAASDTARIGQLFYEQMLKDPVPIPIELLLKTYDYPRLQDYAVFIYWRAFAADADSFIPWDYLRDQFDRKDSNPWRWRQEFDRALLTLRLLPEPFTRIVAEARPKGLYIEPLPRGTQFFDGFPKLNGPLVKLS